MAVASGAGVAGRGPDPVPAQGTEGGDPPAGKPGVADPVRHYLVPKKASNNGI